MDEAEQIMLNIKTLQTSIQGHWQSLAAALDPDDRQDRLERLDKLNADLRKLFERVQ